jgi:hypothetical protein
MSYRSTILSDYPLAYYPLDDFTTSSDAGYIDLLAQNEDYQEILDTYDSYQQITGTKPLTYAELLLTYGTYADVAAAYASYANLGGDIAYDNSECKNDGKYVGRPVGGIVPLVKGNSTAAKIGDSNYIEYIIDKDYSGQTTSSKFATSDSADNDFTLELWFKPNITGSFLTPLFADKTTGSEVGLFYYKGNIVFQVDTEKIEYTIPYTNKSFHVVAVYTNSSLSLYIDSVLEVTKLINTNPFTRTSVNFKTGPCGIGQYFIINSIAAYRYALSQTQINNHYNDAKAIRPAQLIESNGGEWFNLYDDNSRLAYQYAWPSNKAWELFLTEDLYFDQDKQYIAIAKTELLEEKTVVIEDEIVLPGNTMDSSKIEWDGDNGVTVETSDDGITYIQCNNGNEIPQYQINNFSEERRLFIRVTMSTLDSSRYNPRLNYLVVKFYNNMKKMAVNGPSYITPDDGSFILGRVSSEILQRDSRNGLKVNTGSSFKITTTDNINTIEFFYTPYSLSEAGSIIFAGTTLLSWNSNGDLARANIEEIYVNNYTKTGENNIKDILTEGDLNYVVLTFMEPITGEIIMNGSSIGGGTSGLYQNIALYEYQFNALDALNNYNLYRYGDVYILFDLSNSSMTLTESSVEAYDLEWERTTNQ